MSFSVIDFSATADVQRSNVAGQEVVPQTPGSFNPPSMPPAGPGIWLPQDGAFPAHPMDPNEPEEQARLYISLPELELSPAREFDAGGPPPETQTSFEQPQPPQYDITPFTGPLGPPFIPPMDAPPGPHFLPPFVAPPLAPPPFAPFVAFPAPFVPAPFVPPACHAPPPPVPTLGGLNPQFTLQRFLPPPPQSLWLAEPQEHERSCWASEMNRFSFPHLSFFHPYSWNFPHALWELVTVEDATELIRRVCVMVHCCYCPMEMNVMAMEGLVEHYLQEHFSENVTQVQCPWPSCGETLDRGIFGRHFEDLHLKIRKAHCKWCHSTQRADVLKPRFHGKNCSMRGATITGGPKVEKARKKGCAWCMAAERKDLPQVALNARSVLVIVGPALGERTGPSDHTETQ
ncbi:hypothetical protein C8Q78DRAFT_1083035 [Trametes maxima]|nr:hypothetical protein C8Q78DRAFT_1083035 [Trametes maxima]